MNAKTHVVDIAKLDRPVIVSQCKVHLIVGGSLMGNQGYTFRKAKKIKNHDLVSGLS